MTKIHFKNINKHVEDVGVEHILYFESQGALGVVVKHDKKNIRGHWKGSIFLLLRQQGSPKRTLIMAGVPFRLTKDIRDARKVNFSSIGKD
jgi:hypothetical protein